MIYRRWLDHWDERRAQRGDASKVATGLVLDPELAFPAAKGVDSIAAFCALADRTAADSTSFFGLDEVSSEASWQDGWISFPSSVTTDTPANNTVRAKVTKNGSSDHALIVFHHWNATSRSPQLARFFAWRGLTVVEVAMPYHMERRRPASAYADHMLSSNLGRTVQSMRQAVLDGRQLIRILKSAGYRNVSVLGISLGSWVAGLIAAHDLAVEKAMLFLTAGSLADMVWTGRATRHIRTGLEASLDLDDLRRAWRLLNLESYANRLARPDLGLQLVLAERDTVVLPKVSSQLVETLNRAGATARVLNLNCGHYSLSLPPHILHAAFTGARFLHRNPG